MCCVALNQIDSSHMICIRFSVVLGPHCSTLCSPLPFRSDRLIWELSEKNLWNEFCPFYENTGFTWHYLQKILRSQIFESESEESRLFTGANLVLRPASVPAFGEPLRNVKILFFLCRNTFFPRILPLYLCSSNTSTEVVYRPRSWSPLHFDVRNKFTRRNNFLALSVCFPQRCSSAGSRFAVSRSRFRNFQWIVSFPQTKFWWNVL